MIAYQPHELMVCRIAAEVRDGDVVVMGSFTPLAYAAYMLAALTHARNAYLVGFDAVGMTPFRLSFTGSEPAAYRGAACRWPALTEINYIHLAGHGGVEAVSGAQIDGDAAVNLSVIGPYGAPRVRLPGGAGAPEVMKMYRTMVAYLPTHSPRSLVETVDFATGARWKVGAEARRDAGLAVGPVVVVTDLAVLVKDEDEEPFRLESVHPGIDVPDVIEATGFALTIPEEVPTTAEPTRRQLELLRESIDPDGTTRFDIMSGRDRLVYLRELLDREWERGTRAERA